MSGLIVLLLLITGGAIGDGMYLENLFVTNCVARTDVIVAALLFSKFLH